MSYLLKWSSRKCTERVLCALAAFIAAIAFANVGYCLEGFIETFSGEGPFENERLVDPIGFENPGWYVRTDSFFQDGRLWMNNDRLLRELSTVGTGGFRSYAEIRNLNLRSPMPVSGPAVSQSIRSATERSEAISWSINYSDNQFVRIGVTYGETVVVNAHLENSRVFENADLGLLIDYDDVAKQVTFGFDWELDDDMPPTLLGPYSYDAQFTTPIRAHLAFIRNEITANAASGQIDYWSLERICGDLDRNGSVDVADIDLLTEVTHAGEFNGQFDLIPDGKLDEFDRNDWVHGCANTYFGDANVDGDFNSRDLVTVFQAAEYEDAIGMNSTWAEGDWNGDGDFTSRDLVLAFQDGGYELGSHQTASTVVPEPSASAILLGLVTACGTMAMRRV
ncbi:MAG: hypothetical protein KDB27_26805 [Planctomycetales bacterium]|nr:hypothetical protein [Planctomycetales bacterium]